MKSKNKQQKVQNLLAKINHSFSAFFKSPKQIIFSMILFFVLILFCIFILNTYYANTLRPYIQTLDQINTLKKQKTALILGAGLNDNGTAPSLMLQDRLDAGIKLLKTRTVEKLIVSGDNRTEDYNEPEVMKRYLLSKGILKEQIVTDYAGRRTYDSCYRAKAIFRQQSLYVVTQDFHIIRALFICRSMGIDATGIIADARTYPAVWTNTARDYLGMFSAFWDVKIAKPTPVLGEMIEI